MCNKAREHNVGKIILLCLMIIGWIAALFIESSRPPAEIISKYDGLDKVAHFLAFAVLSVLLCALWFKLYPADRIRMLSMPLLIVCLCGGLEESYQLLIPSRTADLADLAADIFGALFAIALSNRIFSRQCKNGGGKALPPS